ncbi:uncharacterized protein [Macrobrachium rosenbergii]|uniref:uncharacterized protein n=1 Tax=Macrobrachium rosenbergii TaxID=79674 RepID=UPI0034D5E217
MWFRPSTVLLPQPGRKPVFLQGGPPQARFPSLAGNLPSSSEVASEEDLPQSRVPPREGFPRVPWGQLSLVVWALPRPASPAWQEACLPPGKQPLRRIFPSQGCLQGKASLGCLGVPQPCGSGPPQARFPSLGALGSSASGFRALPRPASQPGRKPAFLQGSSPERIFPVKGAFKEGFLGCLGVLSLVVQALPRPASQPGETYLPPGREADPEEDLPQSRVPPREGFPRAPWGPTALWFTPSPRPASPACLVVQALPKARFPSLAGSLPSSRKAASVEDLPQSRVPPREGFPRVPWGPSALWFRPSPSPASPAWQETYLPPGKQPLRRIFPSHDASRKASLGRLGVLSLVVQALPKARFPSLAGSLPSSREAASVEDLPQSRMPSREGFPRVPWGPSALWFRPSPRPASPAWQETYLPPGKQPLRRIFPSQGCLQGKASLGRLRVPQPCGSGPPQGPLPQPGRKPASLQ